jgi:hypothetical protein
MYTEECGTCTGAPCKDRSILQASHGRQPPALKKRDKDTPDCPSGLRAAQSRMHADSRMHAPSPGIAVGTARDRPSLRRRFFEQRFCGYDSACVTQACSVLSSEELCLKSAPFRGPAAFSSLLMCGMALGSAASALTTCACISAEIICSPTHHPPSLDVLLLSFTCARIFFAFVFES